jgi:hypothetical protein
LKVYDELDAQEALDAATSVLSLVEITGLFASAGEPAVKEDDQDEDVAAAGDANGP